MRDELLRLEDAHDESEVDLAAPSSDSAADVFHDSLTGESDGEEVEGTVPIEDKETEADTDCESSKESGPPTIKDILLCPPDFRKRGINLDKVEWNIIDHSTLAVVNHLNSYE